MNFEKLKDAEGIFLERFPLGFQSPELIEIVKKHKPEKMQKFAEDSFAETNFEFPLKVTENYIKIATSSSMVSVFEKPKFRDYIKSLNEEEKVLVAESLHKFLYGNEEEGFDYLNQILKNGKMAKWTLLTVVKAYLRPSYDVFVKPTTAKSILSQFEIEGIKYSATPNFYFYNEYRNIINEMKANVKGFKVDSNAAFTGFLMIAMGEFDVE